MMIKEIVHGLRARYGSSNEKIGAQDLICILDNIDNPDYQNEQNYWKSKFYEMQKAETEVSNAYLRLRDKLRKFGALDVHLPGQQFEITEKALDRALLLIDKIKVTINGSDGAQ